MSHNITFLIFTFNEERRIEYILRCFKPYGDVVIMDNHSTDNTVKIAQSYGACVYQHDHPGYVEEENVARNALDKVSTPWVYWGYADEILPKPLLENMQKVAVSKQYKLVKIRRKNIHYGIEHFSLGNDLSPRFFRKGYLDFTGVKIHRFGKFVGKDDEVLILPQTDDYSIYHFSTYNISKFEIAHSKYSDIESMDIEKFSLSRMFYEPIKFFLRYYVMKAGWKHGLAGFIYVMQYCLFFFNIQAKVWEKKNDVTLESIEKKYDKMKEKLLDV